MLTTLGTIVSILAVLLYEHRVSLAMEIGIVVILYHSRDFEDFLDLVFLQVKI